VSITFPITAPGALLPLDAPLPQPRRYTLLDAAQIVPPPDDRWMAGAWINAYPAGVPQTVDPCATGTNRLKNAEAGTARPMAGSFTVVLGGTCTGSSVGSTADWYKARLVTAFEAVEATAVERVFVSGDHHSTLGAYLGDSNMENLSAAAVGPEEGLALLEKAIAEAGNGMIHATPETAIFWARSYLVAPDRQGQMRTAVGTIVAVGAGYINARPDGHPGLGATQDWAFASGFVQIRRDDVTVLPADYAQALDRAVNEVAYYAERDYLITWVGKEDPSDSLHIQAGVLINRT
jgi:hypothetical protein